MKKVADQKLQSYGLGWFSAYIATVILGRVFYADDAPDEVAPMMAWFIPVALGVGLVMTLHLLPLWVYRHLWPSSRWCFFIGALSFVVAGLAGLVGQSVSIYRFVTLVALSPVFGVVIFAAFYRLKPNGKRDDEATR